MDSREYQRLEAYQRRLSRSLPMGYDPYAPPGLYTRDYYVANQVPVTQRLAYGALSLALVGYGAVGVLVDALWIPGRRTSGVVFSGIPAWLACSALCVGALGLLSVVVDHYDRRNNEHRYRDFQRMSRWLSSILLIAAAIGNLWRVVR
jgi:uncharacterized membrane protein